MKASGKIFNNYLDEVRKYFPKGFEDSIRNEGLSQCVTAYLSLAFMNNEDAQKCAKLIIEKLGVEDDQIDSDITNWEDEGGNIKY